MGLLLLTSAVLVFHQFCMSRGKVNSEMPYSTNRQMWIGVKRGKTVTTVQLSKELSVFSFLHFLTSAVFSNFLKGFLHLKEHHLNFYEHKKMVFNDGSCLQEWKGAGV